MKKLIKAFANHLSAFLAWILEGLDDVEKEKVKDKHKKDIDSFIKESRDVDALDGVVKIRKALGDEPKDKE